MDKPKRKEMRHCPEEGYLVGYNQACDDGEKYHAEQQKINNQVLADKCDELDKFVNNLPSEGEIVDIISEHITTETYGIDEYSIAKAISKRLRGEK